MYHADGRGEDGQAVEEVGRAVEGVQHPEGVAGRFLGFLLFLGGFLAQDAVVREAAGDFGGQVRLGCLVGGGHRVALLVVLELDLDAASEVGGQDFAGAASQFYGVALDFAYMGVFVGTARLALRPSSLGQESLARVEQRRQAVNQTGVG